MDDMFGKIFDGLLVTTQVKHTALSEMRETVKSFVKLLYTQDDSSFLSCLVLANPVYLQ